MKFIKTTFLLLSMILLVNCNTKVEGTSEFHPDFKIGKKGFRKALKKEINYDDLTIGTYYTKKNNIAEEKGLNLTFKVSGDGLTNNEEINNKADYLAAQVKKYLLNLEKYDYVNIIFENEKEENGIKKSSSIKIKRKL